MFAVTQRDPVFIHVHRRYIPLTIRFDHGTRLSFPRSPVVLAAIDGQRRGRVSVFNKDENISGRLVDNRAASLKSRFLR